MAERAPEQAGLESTCLQQDAFLNIVTATQELDLKIGEHLRHFGLTVAQYNVLRILRGAGASGLACSQVGERMIRRDPDITRFLDRMEGSGWVLRSRSDADRRVVVAVITEKGLELLDALDNPISQFLTQVFSSLSCERLQALVAALTDIRQNIL